ncbi:hypothetical protein AGABI2DRAFT_190775 [Agaricus bisporus var. bisporus H97]|uniref:hypothetical protein n=1 Tax=Agaricus bisporus var. bisporus (strain H97 / ATCC MYA-4626 / FGSC 10389) TaxID=936046 RepID=UPI00029F5B94|nr:hypothetical protein AGABI2DRAFT_190775 [Agaricus bisporus var. bisporus H97]EKV50448.1 hypothetical protein AGABI2DRAFT_190775 [Agaricus bisporus var. bisporus H97]
MLRKASQSLQPHFRRLHQQARQAPQSRKRTAAAASLISGITVGSYLFYFKPQRIYNDADTSANMSSSSISQMKHDVSPDAESWKDTNTLHSLVWGSSSGRILVTGSHESEGTEGNMRQPTIAKWLEGVALRDLQLHRTHAACVDARGNVYQWGDGFFGSTSKGSAKPMPTLMGMNIVKLQLTDFKVYALSASGKVYVLAADALNQVVPAGQSSSKNSWLNFNWLRKNDRGVRYQELAAMEALGWNEKFVSIAVGDNHLLALTSNGRTFAHPVNKGANRFGQLGLRTFEIADPAAFNTAMKPDTLRIELPPNTAGNKSTKPTQVASSLDVVKDLSNIDDSTIHWCTHLYEIPALRGVDVSQIAAGSRSSFVRTSTGRVLGWGANEFGQIGLGSNVTLRVITVPTEVVLWRMVPQKTQSRCLNVTAKGDLTSFTVERSDTGKPITADLLMCGNGQSGGLGNNTYTNSQGSPARVKNVSGLLQYSDRRQQVEPIMPVTVVISPTGHVMVALDTSAESHGVGGQDLMVWGRNFDYELGNGKKSSLAMPTFLDAPDGERLMLMKRKAKEVLDLGGNVFKKNVNVEQQAAAGYGNSVVYWRVVG